MGATRIAFARAAARAGVLGSIAAVVFLLSGFGTAVVDALSGAATTGLREGLAAATGADDAARWQVRVAAGPRRAGRGRGIRGARPDARVSAGATWSRSVETAPVDAALTGRRSVPCSWPTTACPAGRSSSPGRGPTTLRPGPPPTRRTRAGDPARGAASDARIQSGDLVELQDGDGPRRLMVVGTWRPLDPDEPAWFGEPVVATARFTAPPARS